MKAGIVGLGRMGAGISERWRRNGHEVVGYDRDPKVSQVASLQELVSKLEAPRTVWVMVPDGKPTDSTIEELAGLMQPGDLIIDGGNSYYRDSLRHAQELSAKGIDFIDAGTSGGIWGLQIGFCLMIGGPDEAFKRAEPLFKAMAPEDGYAHVGPAGSGHFVKMVHNGIEYAMLEAYAEGFNLLHGSDFKLDLHQVASVWNHGSVIRSWLLELGESAFANDVDLKHLKAYVDDSGEGRWTILEGVERGIPLPVISQSLFQRFSSRDDNSFAMRFIAALRNEFGGHAVKQA
jgi:6-phosphogluconate dehydrogenase